jgi:hypothetical protein
MSFAISLKQKIHKYQFWFSRDYNRQPLSPRAVNLSDYIAAVYNKSPLLSSIRWCNYAFFDKNLQGIILQKYRTGIFWG